MLNAHININIVTFSHYSLTFQESNNNKVTNQTKKHTLKKQKLLDIRLGYYSCAAFCCFFILNLHVSSFVFQHVHLDFSSPLRAMKPVCSVPSTAAPPAKAPLTVFAATDTIALTQILSRCRVQVCIVLLVICEL